MATTKRDTAYSAFIMKVTPKLTGMSSQELIDLLSDITKRMDFEIEWAKESEIYSEAREAITEEEPHMTVARENCANLEME